MEVVIEEVMFVGVTLNFFIIKLSAKILRRRVRFALMSALIGEIVSLFSPLFQIHFLLKIVLTLLTSLLMLCISFDLVSFENFAVLFAVFIISTFIFGGAGFALKSAIGSFPLFIIAVVGAVVYLLCSLINKVIFKRERLKQFVYKVAIKDRGRCFVEEGYLDSGNVLYDIVSGQPIMLVTFEIFNKIYSQISLVNFLSKEYNLSSIKNGHYIKINSVGKGGQMLVFSVDEVVVGEDKCFQNAMLGLSFSGFEKSFGKRILLHCDMV